MVQNQNDSISRPTPPHTPGQSGDLDASESTSSSPNPAHTHPITDLPAQAPWKIFRADTSCHSPQQSPERTETVSLSEEIAAKWVEEQDQACQAKRDGPTVLKDGVRMASSTVEQEDQHRPDDSRSGG
ncbi:uncharacterized protein JCM15063_005639 [Sporobolomyces koalae]|uniref:uncharacterized protein n=1 Tax=Sporobolomyces koalae TaxID=500713 RepID=UPI00316C3D4B